MKIVDKIVEWWNKTFESDAEEVLGEINATELHFKDPVVRVVYGDGTEEFCEIDQDPTMLVLNKCMLSNEPVFANYSVVERP